jgi:alpha-L-fucosidase
MSIKFRHPAVLLVVAILIGSILLVGGILRKNEVRNSERIADQDPVMWYRNAKFGMFIHWGLYSELAGKWNGQRYYGIGEWIMKRAEIPVGEYEKVAERFNPVQFDAEEWVLLARRAGMKYLIITAKHHDGFSMFDSEVSDFNIVAATSYQKDPLKALANACQKHGIKLGFYYSQTQDWHERDAIGNTWDFDIEKKEFPRYLENKCLPQLEELLTNYGELGILWFDTPGDISAEESRALADWVHAMQPGCLVSSRIGNGMGDYLALGDHQMPDTVINRPFETLYTHNDSWGYTAHDKNFKSPAEIIHLLVKSNAKGGNLLFNVGPKPDGTMPVESVSMLEAVGAWIDKNAEAIYGTTHSPFPDLTWGACTAGPEALYFHVFEWPENARLFVPWFSDEITSIQFLVSGKAIPYKSIPEVGLYLEVPCSMPDPLNTVIKVQYSGQLNISPVRTLMEDYTNTLHPVEAECDGLTGLNELKWSEEFGDWKHATVLDGWQSSEDGAVWTFRAIKPGWYRFILEYSYPADREPVEGLVQLDDQQFYFQSFGTGSKPYHFYEHPIAIVEIGEPGFHKISIKPVNSGGPFVMLKEIEIKRFN